MQVKDRRIRNKNKIATKSKIWCNLIFIASFIGFILEFLYWKAIIAKRFYGLRNKPAL